MEEIKIMRKERKKEKNFIYDYFFSENNQILKIKVFEKKKIFKKFYGEYEFLYSKGLLIQQVSKVEGYGITERIIYQYNQDNLLKNKEYYSEKNQLRYTAQFSYENKTPIKIEVVRMEKYPFFMSEDKELIQKMIQIIGKDFEGAFFLLDLIETAGK